MKKELKLRKPLSVAGKTYTALNYDTDLIDGTDFVDTCNKRAAGVAVSTVQEFDTALFLYFGYCAITKVHPEIDIEDLKRITGADILKIVGIGRFFIMGTEEPEQEEPEAKLKA